MAINPDELAALRADHEAVKGMEFQHFMCPITLRDEPAELMNGHILNEALKSARRLTVIQRKDVDGYFGQIIEPDLINRLNNADAPKEEWFENGRKLFVTLPSGEKVELLHPNKIKDGVFPKIDLLNDDDSVWASGYVKTGAQNLQGADDIYVGHSFRAREGAVIGAWMKAAFLAMFKLRGYRYVYSEAGDFIRRPLCDFVLNNRINAEADPQFKGFAGACGSILGPEASNVPETLGENVVLLRSDDHGLFASSLLFRVNGTLHVVTVPIGDDKAQVVDRYLKLIDDPQYPHDLRLVRFDGHDSRVVMGKVLLPVRDASTGGSVT